MAGQAKAEQIRQGRCWNEVGFYLWYSVMKLTIWPENLYPTSMNITSFLKK